MYETYAYSASHTRILFLRGSYVCTLVGLGWVRWWTNPRVTRNSTDQTRTMDGLEFA